MSRITPGEVITHTEQEILDLVGGGTGGLQEQIDSINSDLHVVTTDLNQTKTELATTNSNLTTAVNDLNAAKTDLQQTQQDLETAQVDIVTLRDDMTNLPKGTVVVTSLPASPVEVDNAQVVFLDVLDQNLRGLYSWDGSEWINVGALADGSVTAEKLSPGLILIAEIEAGEIKETHIADDSISTPKLRAGSVTTSKLVVGNFANLCENNDFELGDTSSWIKEQGWTINNDSTNAYTGSWIAKRAGYAVGSVLRNVKFKCTIGQKYIASTQIKLESGTDGYGYVRITGYDSNDVETVLGTGTQISTTTFSRSEAITEIPAGIVNLRVEVVATNTTGFIYVDQVVLSINSLTVIEDGSITTKKLAAFSVTANKIAAGQVTAEKIDVTNLSAIKADMGNITAGTLTFDAGGHVKAGQTDFNTGNGFWLGKHWTGPYVFSIGNSTQGVTWDGTTFNIKGGAININNKFISDTSGNVIIRSGTSGARLEIKNDVIKVFDANGVLRVKLGNLSL